MRTPLAPLQRGGGQRCPHSTAPPILAHVLWPRLHGSRWHLVWIGGRPRPLPHCVRWGPTPQGGTPAPSFRPMSVVAIRLHGSRWHLVWIGGRPRPLPHCVRRGPTPKGHSRPPNFRPIYVCCGQTAGWIKMPLDREVDVGPGDSVLHGDPAPPKSTAPNFQPMSVVTKRLDG